MRDIVAETLVDLPMLRSVERRMVLEVRHICVHMHMHMSYVYAYVYAYAYAYV